MCGRYTLTVDLRDIAERFGVAADQEAPAGADPALAAGPRYNIAPTQLVITVAANGARHVEPMRWGLIPSWAKDPKIGSRLINARAETLAEKPAFRSALRRRRCLLPSDSFYEWATVPGSKAKRPMRVRLKSGEVYAFAGLWDEWTPPEGGPAVRSCTIVTTEPNELMATFHHRMPVILSPQAEAAWLDPRISDPSQLVPLLRPYPADLMEAYPVSPAVNSIANDSAQLILPLE
ncbi:MAG TPA: SOS response-associated peptidase [Chloroflexota bacterium]|nr:SOS response-associated peptidase [Chloroflexota bacterium]